MKTQSIVKEIGRTITVKITVKNWQSAKETYESLKGKVRNSQSSQISSRKEERKSKLLLHCYPPFPIRHIQYITG